ncbi:MAG: sensor histidine kinase [Cryomorphaceae bacterium]
MEEIKDLILYIVIASSSVVLLLVAILFDLYVLFRKRKVIAQQEIKIRENKIDELIMKKEVENMSSLLKGQNSERRRISQELHDRLGSILFTAKLYHGNTLIENETDQKEKKEDLGKLTALLDDAVQEVRRISHDLYDGSLANFDYSVALQQLIKAIEESNDIRIKMNTEGDIENLNEEIQYELYAITQELLSNTLKHAKARNVEIEIRNEDELIFHYHDNGNGFDNRASYSGIGLKNIENRVAKFDGKLTIESGFDKGTFYFITIPLST